MKLQVHSFIEPVHFEQAAKMYEEQIQDSLQLLSKGEGDVQAICRQILRFSLWNGCIALILGRPDDEPLRYFRQAVGYGVQSLEAPGSTKTHRVYHSIVEVGETGTREIATHEIKQPRRPRTLTVSEYADVLMTTVCFGQVEQIERVAQYPEEKYRNPDVVVEGDYFAWLRAVKYALRDEVTGAVREAQTALAAFRQAAVKEHIEAFLCLLGGDRDGFGKHLEKRLSWHKKQYQKLPNEPEGVYCQPALMLCRIAIDRGFAVEEWPYLPVRLLPNFRDVETH